MSKQILIVWLIVDLIWGLALLGGCAYLVFWKGYSGWWFVLAIIPSASMGGDKLYKRLDDAAKPARTERKGN